MRVGLVLCLVVGCGSSGAKKDADPLAAQRDAFAQREKEIDAMKPASPYEFHDRAVYQTTERCGQGPYRVEADSVPAKFGEELMVYACAKHAIAGNYRLTTQRAGSKGKPDINEGHWGYETVDNAACKAKDVAVASGGGGAASSGGANGRGAASGGGVTAASSATMQSQSLQAGGEVPADCDRIGVLDMSYTSNAGDDPLDGHVIIDIWSDEPNDLEGLVLVVEHHLVRANMTVEDWKAYNDAYEAWVTAWNAHVANEVNAGVATRVDFSVKTPPPPAPRAETQPPKPSKNARWIPGYWLYAEASFHWISGMWDVPEEDIRKELTVQAPTPPPATPHADQPTEPQPTKTAVWTPGSWQWDGRAYVWVAGAWRVPPDEQHTWQPAGWTISAGASVYIPGGWRVSIHR